MPLPTGVNAVNIGCGTSVAAGWINIDNSPNGRLSKYPLLKWILWKLRILSDRHYRVNWPEALLIHDVRKRLPFPDSSIDYVYTSHFLEHNSLSDAKKLIADVFRILKSGGVFRVVVPDLAIGAQRYLNALQETPPNKEAAADFLNWLQLSRPGVRDPHLWMYDAPSLTAMLVEQGFANVVVRQFRQGRVPDCDVLDNRGEDSLYIEAEKDSQVDRRRAS